MPVTLDDEAAPAGEARIATGGGFAHIPGLARERVIPFDTLPRDAACEIAALAAEADFFRCVPAPEPARPDARTYRVALTIGGETRRMSLAEPIRDPALARLVSTLRRLSRNTTGPQ